MTGFACSEIYSQARGTWSRQEGAAEFESVDGVGTGPSLGGRPEADPSILKALIVFNGNDVG